MAGPTDLERGSYAGKETYLYYNSATYASPTWVLIARARNVQRNRGTTLSEVDYHGAAETGNVPGYKKFSGSFEYVRRKGTDTVWAFIEAARDAGDIVDLAHLNGTIVLDASVGWRAPVLLGETTESSNGSDGVVVTVPFAKADAYNTSGGASVDYAAFTGTTP